MIVIIPQQTQTTLEQYLEQVTYPVSQNALFVQAQQHQASREVLALLHSLPNRVYHSRTEVEQALSGQPIKDPVDAALSDSFPASDPPPWNA
ncbi:MAG: DUF2795 domain-containing protein [Chloroflexaceae bacterium]|nr:DUF2795 domain-containing protein [Chloroflexaceae bacterium]